MNRTPLLAASLTALLLAGVPLQSTRAGDESGLVTWMGRLQYFTHKLGLAVDARNRPLQGYYAHEVEEVIEHIREIPEVDGVEIGALVEATGAGQVEAVIRESGGPNLRAVTLFDRYRGSPLSADEKSLAYRLRFEFVDAATEEDAVDPAVEQVVAVLSERLGARLRS